MSFSNASPRSPPASRSESIGYGRPTVPVTVPETGVCAAAALAREATRMGPANSEAQATVFQTATTDVSGSASMSCRAPSPPQLSAAPSGASSSLFAAAGSHGSFLSPFPETLHASRPGGAFGQASGPAGHRRAEAVGYLEDGGRVETRREVADEVHEEARLCSSQRHPVAARRLESHNGGITAIPMAKAPGHSWRLRVRFRRLASNARHQLRRKAPPTVCRC